VLLEVHESKIDFKKVHEQFDWKNNLNYPNFSFKQDLLRVEEIKQGKDTKTLEPYIWQTFKDYKFQLVPHHPKEKELDNEFTFVLHEQKTSIK
jgi:hypothetical protein